MMDWFEDVKMKPSRMIAVVKNRHFFTYDTYGFAGSGGGIFVGRCTLSIRAGSYSY
jgi:hypothetical protein